ncbi:hypothetical protein OL548_09970 [Lysinibacillus sp. MHQ-1]|nr:hypothetical protein OL548_09970 [Lysinibacillus sp. MHQ-1]
MAAFLLNPLLYIAIIFAILLGYRRVKQERKYFNRRIIWGWTELIGQWKDGWLYALLISLISVAAGLTVPKVFFNPCNSSLYRRARIVFPECFVTYFNHGCSNASNMGYVLLQLVIYLGGAFPWQVSI